MRPVPNSRSRLTSTFRAGYLQSTSHCSANSAPRRHHGAGTTHRLKCNFPSVQNPQHHGRMKLASHSSCSPPHCESSRCAIPMRSPAALVHWAAAHLMRVDSRVPSLRRSASMLPRFRLAVARGDACALFPPSPDRMGPPGARPMRLGGPADCYRGLNVKTMAHVGPGQQARHRWVEGWQVGLVP